jgi:acetoin utilization protein AcuA
MGKDRPDRLPKRITLNTPHGEVTLYHKCPPGYFSHLQLESGLGNFAHYSSIIQKLDVFERVAAQPEGRVTICLNEQGALVAYACCWYPEKEDRWSKLGTLMYELGALEVSRNYRHGGIADAIVGTLMADTFFEEKIAYMNGYCWHWDLDGTGLTMMQYRQMMINFLKKFGFQEYYTNEPNIALREENIFMARIGSHVSEEDQRRFRNLRFGIVDRS